MSGGQMFHIWSRVVGAGLRQSTLYQQRAEQTLGFSLEPVAARCATANSARVIVVEQTSPQDMS